MTILWFLACALVASTVAPVWVDLARATTNSPSPTSSTVVFALALPAVAAVIGWRFTGDPALPAWSWAGLHTVPLAVLDLRQHRLPRWWLASFAAGGVCLFAAVVVVDHDLGRLVRAVLAGVGMWSVMRVFEWACGGRMGGADTRLHAVLALYTGWMSWHAVVIGFLGGSVLLGITAGIAYMWRRRAWSSRIAAAPSLLAGAWFALVITGP